MTAERLGSSAARLRGLAGEHASQVSRTVRELDALSPAVLGSTDLADAVAAFTDKLHSVARAESRMMETSAEDLVASAAAMTGQDRDIAEGLRTLDPHQGGHTPSGTSHAGTSHSGPSRNGHRHAHTAHRTGTGGKDPARTHHRLRSDPLDIPPDTRSGTGTASDGGGDGHREGGGAGGGAGGNEGGARGRQR